MAKSSYKGRGYGKGYKVSRVLEAFKKIPEYRRGFKTKALWGGGKVRRELGNPEKRMSGRKLVNYLKKKRGFSYDKIETFFKNISASGAPKQKAAIPSPEKPKKIEKLSKELEKPRQKIRPETAKKIKPEERQKPLAKEKPGARPFQKSAQRPAEWMKEIGRQRIKFEKEKTTSFASRASSGVAKKTGKAGAFGPEIKKAPRQAPKTHEEIVQEEKARRTEYEEAQKQNIQKSQELDKKETEEEGQISKVMEEEFKPSADMGDEGETRGGEETS